VFNYKGEMFILVDDKLEFTDKYLRPFSEFDITKEYDYADNNHNNLLIYFEYKRPTNRQVPNQAPSFDTFIFKKNKLYDFSNWHDELGNKCINIWYDLFQFVKKEDYNQAIRALKLKEIDKIK
jgi:hypothetical protein